MEELVPILREFGFPIVVCSWFMLRYEKRIDKLTNRIGRLITLNTVMVKALDAEEFEAELDTLDED